MKSTVVCLTVSILCLLQCSVNGVENQAPDHPEYTRSGTCNFTQECLYKYHAAQYTLGENDRKQFLLSTDVHWHCESSGSFGTHPANEYCFTLSNTTITPPTGFNSSTNIHYTTNGEDEMATALKEKLKGNFCYVQTKDGRIVSIHYSPTESEDGVNVKRGIAGAFQANFDKNKEVEESDPGSTHISHYSFLKTSDNVISFTRTFKTNDLIEITGAPKNSLNYTKIEKSTFINKILYSSRGMLESRIEFGHDQNSEPSSATFNPKFDLGKEFEANGTYVLERVYCKQRSKRSLVFADLAAPNIQKGSIKAVIDLANLHRHKMKTIRNAIPSIPRFLEEIRRNPSMKLVDTLQKLLKLEAVYGTPSQYKSTIDQLINYYKQIQASNKSVDIEMRKIMYTFFSTDSSPPSQKVLGSALKKELDEDEQDALLRQLATIKNANLDLVNTVINHITSSDDDIVPVLGAMARHSNFTVQKVVIDELLARLNAALSSSDNEAAVTTLIYALGNSGSQLAVSPLLFMLQYDDIDIQISAIRGLASHLNQPAVQQAIITLLSSTNEDKILEETLKILIDALEYKILTSPGNELISAIINNAIYLENANLYELVKIYLHQLNTDEIHSYLDLLKQQYNYGDVEHEHMGDMDKNNSRVKRGVDWDESNSNYNLVATLADRRNDVKNFPKHLAYIWGGTLGVSNMKMKVGAGGFAGIKIGSSSADYKLFARVGANVHVFGRNYKVANLEISRYTSNNNIYDKIYLWDGSSLNKNLVTKAVTIAVKRDISVYGSLPIFNTDISIYVYVGHISVGIRGRVSIGMGMGLCGALQFPPVSQPKARCHAKFKLSFDMDVDGDTHTTLLGTVEIGVDVSSSFAFSLYPELKVEAIVKLPDILDILSNCIPPPFEIKTCVQLSYSYDIDVEVDPWYKVKRVSVSWRGISISWGPKKTCCGIDWSSYQGTTLLLSACPSAIESCL